MTTYYKAVHPDGTDFATGTTRPVVGAWMPRIDGPLKLCKHGYHVSDAPGETLIGGTWPCRLFEVEIKENALPEHIDGHKRVVHTYRPIREIPASQALGPNGEAVAALIERARRLTPGEAGILDATRAAAWNAAFHAAGDATRAAAWSAAWNAAWNAAGKAARTAAGDAAGDAARTAVGNAAGDVAWDAERAARAAACALVVRDLITPEQFATLYGPWASVIGEPA